MRKLLLLTSITLGVVALVLVGRWVATSSDTSVSTPVVIAVPNWPSARAKAHVFKLIIEDNFGIEVQLRNSTNTVIFEGMNNGSMHVHPEVWLPNVDNLRREFVEKRKTVRQSPKSTPADQRICVTKGTVQRTGIVNLRDLSDPRMAKNFDRDGDGRGEMWIGASGWSSTNIEKIRAKSYGYAATMQLREMDEVLALAQLDAAVTKKDNIVFYCDSPHYTFVLYELVILKEEPHDPNQWNIVQPTEDPDWLERSHALTAWKKASLHVFYAAALEQSHPVIAKMLSQVEFDGKMVAAMNYALAVEKTSSTEFARKWVTENAALVDNWLF